MKDWRAIAGGGDFQIPPRDLDRMVEPLNALEKAFRPLVKALDPDLEPATVCKLEEGE